MSPGIAKWCCVCRTSVFDRVNWSCACGAVTIRCPELTTLSLLVQRSIANVNALASRWSRWTPRAHISGIYCRNPAHWHLVGIELASLSLDPACAGRCMCGLNLTLNCLNRGNDFGEASWPCCSRQYLGTWGKHCGHVYDYAWGKHLDFGRAPEGYKGLLGRVSKGLWKGFLEKVIWTSS